MFPRQQPSSWTPLGHLKDQTTASAFSCSTITARGATATSSPCSGAAVGCKVLWAELCLLWQPCHSDNETSHPAQGLQRQVLHHRTSPWGRKARRVCSLKDWTAAVFYNPLSLLIRFIIFMPSLVFYRGYEGILCYSVPALLPTHNISPAYIEQSSGTAGPDGPVPAEGTGPPWHLPKTQSIPMCPLSLSRAGDQPSAESDPAYPSVFSQRLIQLSAPLIHHS